LALLSCAGGDPDHSFPVVNSVARSGPQRQNAWGGERRSQVRARGSGVSSQFDGIKSTNPSWR